jgi:SET domain-containing protein
VHAYGQLWDGLVLPESPPEVRDASAHHFRLPVSFQQEVRNKPPEFKSINKLDYDSLPQKEKGVPRVTPDEKCRCVEECGEMCLNRLSKIECFESNIPKEDDICPIGPGCGNRCLQERRYAKTERFQEWAMGWGLRAKEFIPEGTLVIEYLGEVIDEQQMQTRMQNQRKYTPNDPNFYIMQLDSGLYVDGKHKGNESRFINHSCDPNCELQPWLVRGRMRIGIFAIRDIEPEEPLSYDYQFDTNVSTNGGNN